MAQGLSEARLEEPPAAADAAVAGAAVAAAAAADDESVDAGPWVTAVEISAAVAEGHAAAFGYGRRRLLRPQRWLLVACAAAFLLTAPQLAFALADSVLDAQLGYDLRMAPWLTDFTEPLAWSALLVPALFALWLWRLTRTGQLGLLGAGAARLTTRRTWLLGAVVTAFSLGMLVTSFVADSRAAQGALAMAARSRDGKHDAYLYLGGHECGSSIYLAGAREWIAARIDSPAISCEAQRTARLGWSEDGAHPLVVDAAGAPLVDELARRAATRGRR